MPIEQTILELERAARAKAAEPAIDVGILQIMHWGENAYVGFARKPLEPTFDRKGRPVQFQNLFAIPASELADLQKETLAPMLPYLFKDSYFTINSAYRAGWGKSALTGLPNVARKESDLKYLNVCYVDIDCGRKASEATEPNQTLTQHETLARIFYMIGDGVLPEFSIAALSGRGVYVFWLLIDDQTGQPPRAFKEKIDLYKLINKTIGQRVADYQLPADRGAFDAARVLRTPGSVHSKAMRATKYVAQYGHDNKLHFYTLPQLVQFFDLKVMQASQRDHFVIDLSKVVHFRRIEKRGSSHRRRNGWETLQKKRIADLMAIEQWQQGFKRGWRRRALTLYAEFMFNLNTAEPIMLQALQDMASNCNPPFPSDPDDQTVEQILKNALALDPRTKQPKRRNHKNESLCRLFGITYEVAQELDLQTIIPPELKAERKQFKPPSGRAVERQRRLDALRQMVAIHGKGFGCRVFVKALADVGIKSNRQTVNVDLRSIGYVLPKQRHVKRKKKP